MTAPSLSAQIQGQGTVSADNLNTFIQTAQITSQLRSFTGLPGMVVFLQGVSFANDGNGGLFFWNSSGTQPDDNFNYIVPSNAATGEWQRMSTSNVGTTTGNNAPAGIVGEFVSSAASLVSLTTNTPANVTTLSLSAGDWEVFGTVQLVPAATTTVSNTQAGINTTSATIPASTSGFGLEQGLFPSTTSINLAYSLMESRVNITSTTNVFLVAQATFSISTMTASGFIAARRIR